jgi:hypothetical protein
MSTEQTTKTTGACLCGGVKYEIDGPLSGVIYCHCEQCRKTSGHYCAATSCKREDLDITVDDSLCWYQSSPEAERGFCNQCGSSLFWNHKDAPSISVFPGSLDLPTGLKADAHIFVADASDYYSIDDGLPQHADYGTINAAE